MRELRFGDAELAYLGSLGFDEEFLDYLSGFRFSGDIDAIPEGTVCFANEPLLRVTGPRIEAQLLETLLLNQVNFQTMVATKAARVVLAAGGGEPGAGDAVIDFSPRRDHGIDAAMKVARSGGGRGLRRDVERRRRDALRPAPGRNDGPLVRDVVRARARRLPGLPRGLPGQHGAPRRHLRHARGRPQRDRRLARHRGAAARRAARLGRPARAVARGREDARRGRDAETRIVASGDLEEHRIAELVAAGAPIDLWGVGTELGTSRDSPVVNGVYKLVADRGRGGWRGVWKRSPDKATHPGAKQVFRAYANGTMTGDVIAAEDEEPGGEPLLVAVMRGGEIVREETLDEIRERTAAQLAALPRRAASPGGRGRRPTR